MHIINVSPESDGITAWRLCYILVPVSTMEERYEPKSIPRNSSPVVYPPCQDTGRRRGRVG